MTMGGGTPRLSFGRITKTPPSGTKLNGQQLRLLQLRVMLLLLSLVLLGLQHLRQLLLSPLLHLMHVMLFSPSHRSLVRQMLLSLLLHLRHLLLSPLLHLRSLVLLSLVHLRQLVLSPMLHLMHVVLFSLGHWSLVRQMLLGLLQVLTREDVEFLRGCAGTTASSLVILCLLLQTRQLMTRLSLLRLLLHLALSNLLCFCHLGRDRSSWKQLFPASKMSWLPAATPSTLPLTHARP